MKCISCGIEFGTTTTDNITICLSCADNNTLCSSCADKWIKEQAEINEEYKKTISDSSGDVLNKINHDLTINGVLTSIHNNNNDVAITESKNLKHVKTINNQNNDKLYGWICPICGRGISPFVDICHCTSYENTAITCIDSIDTSVTDQKIKTNQFDENNQTNSKITAFDDGFTTTTLS